MTVLLWGAVSAVPATVGVSGQDAVLAFVSILGTAGHVQLEQFTLCLHVQLPLPTTTNKTNNARGLTQNTKLRLLSGNSQWKAEKSCWQQWTDEDLEGMQP